MAAPSTGELLQAIGGFLTAAVGVALGIGTLVQRSRSGGVDTFQAVNAALQAENKRCWEENDRLRKDLQEVEEARDRRVDQVHVLNNSLQVYQMLVHEYVQRYGQIPGLELPDDKGEAK